MNTLSDAITVEDLLDTMKRIDGILRPYLVFLNPQDKDYILSKNPDSEKQCVVQPTDYVEKGKCLIMKRDVVFEDIFNFDLSTSTPFETKAQ